MKIRLSNRSIVLLHSGLSRLMAYDIDPEVANRISHALIVLDRPLRAFRHTREKLARHVAKRDREGGRVRTDDGGYEIAPEHAEAWKEKLETLWDAEIALDLPVFSLEEISAQFPAREDRGNTDADNTDDRVAKAPPGWVIHAIQPVLENTIAHEQPDDAPDLEALIGLDSNGRRIPEMTRS